MIRSQIAPSLLMTIYITIVTGFIFPGLLWCIAHVASPESAGGSLAMQEGKIIGSHLLGQSFSADKYFHPRPSAAGSGYDPLSSGGTNLGPTSAKLIHGQADNPETPDSDETFLGIEQLAQKFREENGLSATALVPVDAVTRSASGLDPHITLQNARLQADRVARARGKSIAEVNTAIDKITEGRFLGIFGEPRVNVLELNLELDAHR